MSEERDALLREADRMVEALRQRAADSVRAKLGPTPADLERERLARETANAPTPVKE